MTALTLVLLHLDLRLQAGRFRPLVELTHRRFDRTLDVLSTPRPLDTDMPCLLSVGCALVTLVLLMLALPVSLRARLVAAPTFTADQQVLEHVHITSIPATVLPP